MTPPEPTPSKYVPGAEIGRGGLSRVVEATDREIGRSVALKLLLDGAPLDVVERFRREGRVTGRLEHPNIVPVYDVGTLPAARGGAPEVFFAMKKIAGRDMGAVIRGLRRGEEGEWTQRRLVEALRDACRAVAYAHSKGVIHRDLKPSNVMLGEFGEVLVVDWGLAKEKGSADGPAGASGRGWSAQMTLQGDIVGTPEYMSPEQASGRVGEVDERSDVYALGAILYEILTWRPPFVGESADQVLDRVRHSTPVQPSLAIGRAAGEDPRRPPEAPSARPGPAPVPAELEQVCLRALARVPADRYSSAAALGAALDDWLAGTAERERRRRLAGEQAAAARGHAGRWRRLAAEARETMAGCVTVAIGMARWAPLDRYREMWAKEDRARALEREAAAAFAEAEAALASALSNDPEHAEARGVKADLWLARFAEAEAAKHAGEAVLARRMAEQYDDGSRAAALRGDGTLEVRARAYPCRCLLDGREVAPAELNAGGYHPWSGRRLSGPPGACAPEHEPAAPRRLRVHAAVCSPVPAAGARVWAYRYEEEDRLLIPRTPPGAEAGPPPPPEALETLFGGSPFRPRGPGLYLGTAPTAARPVPFGSWLLVVVPPEGPPLRVPCVVGRLAHVALVVTVYRPGEVPEGFLPIAAGPFLFGYDPTGVPGNNESLLDVDDVFVARHPVTCAEYLAFLNDLHRRDPAAAARRAPRPEPSAAPYWPATAAGYAIPTAEWRATAPADLQARAFRLRDTAADWRPDWPVCAISWLDAVAFAAASSRDRVFTLADDVVWEKAARGPDVRETPWGDTPVDIYANSGGAFGGGPHPCAIEEFPTDESPYGVRGLAGNVATHLLSDIGTQNSEWRSARGGRWAANNATQRARGKFGNNVASVVVSFGARLCAPVRLSGADARPELNWKRGVTGKR